MDMTEFQNDLKNMSLNDALTKHNISLSDALKNIKKPITKPKKRYVEVYNADTYIQCRDGKFYLRKSVYNPKTKQSTTLIFGTYKTLKDAQRMREAQKKIGWKRHRTDELCEQLGIERCKDPRCTVRYS